MPAGSWCKLQTVIKASLQHFHARILLLTCSKSSRKHLDRYEVIAVLTNIDGLTYVSRKFVLPSRAPQYALARYGCYWDAVNHAVKVELRSTSRKVETTFTPTVLIYATSNQNGHACLPHDLGLTANDASPVPSSPDRDRSTLARIERTIGGLAQPHDADFPPCVLPSPTTACNDGEIAGIATSTTVQADQGCNGLEDSCLESPVKTRERSSSPSSASTHVLEYELDDSLQESPVKAHLIARPGAPTPGRGRTQYLCDSDDDEEGHTLIVADDSRKDDVFGSGEVRMSWYDSYEKLPRLDPGVVDLSVAVDALDLAAEHNTCPVHSCLEWLNLDSREEIRGYVEDIIDRHQHMTHQDMQDWMQEAMEEVGSILLPSPCVHENAAMEIDLDAYFDGQGATDLEDNVSQGNNEQLREGASLCHAPDQTVSITFDHYNWFGDRIPLRSSTPAGVSLLVQLAADRKRPFAEVCRKGVLLAQANKYVDVVDYNGPLSFDELQALRGAAFQDHVTGHAVKITDPEGHFCDPRDGDAALKDFDSIWDHFLVPKTQPTMQRPYLVADLGQDHGQSKGWIVPPPNSTQFFRQRNAKGEVVHWGLAGAEKPSNRCSKLYLTHSLDDELEQPSATPGQIEELSDSSQGSSTSAEEKDADTKYPSESDEASVEEYSPFDPVIPGQQRIYEADPEPEGEISEEEMQRRVNVLLELNKNLEQDPADRKGQQEHSGDSASEYESSDNEGQRSSRATTPPSPAILKPFDHSVYDSSSTFSKICAIEDSTSVPGAVAVKPLDDAVATPIPTESIHQPAQPEPLTEASQSTCTEQPEEQGLSRYAFAYGCLMFGIGIGAAILF